MKYAFAGDREVAVEVLQFILDEGFSPEALLISGQDHATHAEELIQLSGLSNKNVFQGKEFNTNYCHLRLKEMDLDYIIGVHFPYIITKEVLAIPKIGFLNLHPAYLPFNKGWHTPSWAILDQSPFGATLHFMAEELDAGDIIHQKELKIRPDHTAHKLYQDVLSLEVEVFKEAWKDLMSKSINAKSQHGYGTSHKKRDLFTEAVQRIDLNKAVLPSVLIDKLRALSTNKWNEAAYFEKEGRKYRVRIDIKLDEE